MNTEAFRIGDRVLMKLTLSEPGQQVTGEICSSFYTPEKKVYNDVPVQWDDGTRSYVNPGSLEYEYV